MTEAALLERILDGRSLDGAGNNEADSALGWAGQIYPRVTAANYADGVGEMLDHPSPRYVSNRISNDVAQNLFSSRGVSHWGFVWGQFLDHTFGKVEEGTEDARLAFDATDPLERFENELGGIAFSRSAVADGTGTDDTPRGQVNTVSSYIDAWAVYGGADVRLDWLRVGSVDGDPTNNEATLLLVDGYLPTAAARPEATVPEMAYMGRLMGDASAAVVAGDVRANENIALTAVHTLFAREHDRIVAALPDELDEEVKFQIARRIVGAEQQWITYTEWLPALGVDLATYEGYDPTVDPSITDEFATVGYRAHSQIHGEFETEIPLAETTPEKLAALEAAGVEVEMADDEVEITVPLNVAFANPGLVPLIGLGRLLTGLASEADYQNDEMIDEQLRSVLFQVPRPDMEDPMECLDGPTLPECFSGVTDLGAIDMARGYDHGMPTYNQMRIAYGLAPATSFTDVTGEQTEEFPVDPVLDPVDTIDDPDILDFLDLTGAGGQPIEIGTDAADTEAVVGTRRTTVASRLKATYGDVDALDAFTGMLSEPHIPDTEFGELQLAMWKAQFAALRDGDRYYYGNDPVLDEIADTYGIDYRVSLTAVIAANTDVPADEVPADVFFVADEPDTDDPDTEPDPTDAPDPATRRWHPTPAPPLGPAASTHARCALLNDPGHSSSD